MIVDDKSQQQLSKETGIAKPHISTLLSEIKQCKNMLRGNIYKVLKAQGVKRVTVEIK